MPSNLWPFDHQISRVHPWLMVSQCVKFKDERYKGIKGKQLWAKKCQLTMRFYLALWPRNQRAHSRLMGSLCVKLYYKNFSLLYPLMYSFWSYASLKFVEAGRGHVLLQQYLQYACYCSYALKTVLVLYSSKKFSTTCAIQLYSHFPKILQTARKINHVYWKKS